MWARASIEFVFTPHKFDPTAGGHSTVLQAVKYCGRRGGARHVLEHVSQFEMAPGLQCESVRNANPA